MNRRAVIFSPICLALITVGLERPVSTTTSQTAAQGSFVQGQALADQTMNDLNAQGIGTLAAKPIGLLIAEGDSWFSYPGLDVLGALGGGKLDGGGRYKVYSAAKAGDTVEAMAYGAENREGFAAEFLKVADTKAQKEVTAILLSGGGNDLAGPEFRILLNHASSTAGTLSPLDSAMADLFLDRITRNLESLVGTAHGLAQAILGRSDIPILIHGYAPPVPDGRPFLTGWGPLPGPWLEPGFAAKGYITDEDEAELLRNTKIMEDLITRFNARVKQIETKLAPLVDVRYVDVRHATNNLVPKNEYKQAWSNELHPRDAAFIKVAKAFHDKILKK